MFVVDTQEENAFFFLEICGKFFAALTPLRGGVQRAEKRALRQGKERCGFRVSAVGSATMPCMNTKTKQIIKIALLLAASAFFLFQGFSMLFSEQENVKTEQITPAE